MAGNYYNGYMQSKPRTLRQPKFRLVFVDSGSLGGRVKRREHTAMTVEEFDPQIAILAQLGISYTVERWHRNKGWIAI